MPSEMTDIIVVDDNQVLLSVIAEIFKECGYIVRTATNGFAALAQIRRKVGSARVPREATIESLKRWEEGFFESEFTHPNAAKKLTEHPGGFIGLWMSLIGKRRFPVEYLADAKETLVQFLQR